MRGTLKKRYKGSWSLILDLGYVTVTDPETDKKTKQRRQKWVTFRGTQKQAEKKLNDLVHAANRGEFVEPSKMTLGEWLTEWLEKTIKAHKKSSTYDRYKNILDTYLAPRLGSVPLQSLRVMDVEAYYAGLRPLAPSTVQIHHAFLQCALSKAVTNGLVTRNVAALVEHKPKKPKGGQDVLGHVWAPEEAAKFLTVAKEVGPQVAAFYSLALDTGARRGELAALKWSDLDFASARLTVQRHLVKGGHEPIFGTTKTGTSRTIELSAETLALLKTHRQSQSALKLKNRTAYHDHGLMFAKEWTEARGGDLLGAPLQVNNIAEREFNRLILTAGVKRIKFHGLRHTCATLLLLAGVQPHVVQRRLGHSNIQMTLGTYGHVLPSMQADAAGKLAALLHG